MAISVTSLFYHYIYKMILFRCFHSYVFMILIGHHEFCIIELPDLMILTQITTTERNH